MTFTTAHLSISLDGFVAGPDQTLEDPIGRGGMALHQWHLERPPRPRRRRALDGTAAAAAGRVRDGAQHVRPVRGPWSSYDGDWRGWWGEEPPYHAPVFVLTHQEHEPIEMAGGPRSTSSPAASRRR